MDDEEIAQALRESEPIGHVCIYLKGLEIHSDIHSDETDIGRLAAGIGEFITQAILMSEQPGCLN